MPIYIDDEFITMTGANLGAALDAAAERLAASGRVVVEVMLEGAVLAGDQIDARRGEAIDQRDLRLVSADPRALSVETLEQIQARLGDARRLQDDAADLLQRDDASAALRKVGEAIEVWLQTQQAVLHSAAITGLDLDAVAVDNEPLSAFTEQLLSRLQELKGLIESGDLVALADALAYEWPEEVARWEALIAALIQTLSRQAES